MPKSRPMPPLTLGSFVKIPIQGIAQRDSSHMADHRCPNGALRVSWEHMMLNEDSPVQKLILLAVGQDKPGIVAAFSQVLCDTGCNIEDTSMTLLEDHFTMLFIVHAPQGVTIPSLEAQLKQVTQDFHLSLAIYPIHTERETPESTGRPWMISVTGPDHTGIVYHVTRYLASRNINIRHLSSKRLSRPAGNTVFLMALEVDIPEAVSDAELQQDLAGIRQAHSLEIHAEPLEVYTL